MRIRKRWPLPPPPPTLPPPPPPSSPPPVKVTPDLPCTRPLDPQSQSLGGDGGGGVGGGLYSLADLSVHVSNRQSTSPPHDSPNPSLRQRPDLQLTIVRGTNGWICAGTGRDVNPEGRADSNCSCLHLVPSPPTHLQKSQVVASLVANGGGTVGKHVEKKSLAAANNQINENNLGAATSFGISASPSLFHQGKRWCEGEKAFPLKKRRGSFERRLTDNTIMEKEKKMKTKVRSKVAKKWVHENEEEDDDDEKHGEVLRQRGREDGVVNSKGGKKRGNGGLIMEGSRCSRVNGRGWRCCQQTLVGYFLCEHHLGKGRLRSMSSVRNRASTIANNNRPNHKKLEDESGLLSSSSSSTSNTQCLNKSLDKESLEEDDDDKEEDEKPLKKIGMVKARSIRSLLGQTLLAPAVTLRQSSNPIGHNMVA
ncbi:uncharacterized protein LOC122088564 [Macadamia integrifolia]|uniref:uncharacterized protein LOC122088564 n=1 Tax=Macadamia integrifolia TaxID=60698 RepID=UPI001C4F0E7F|nr:uncharacterized protein LOC122088564 [Macadamia integrifolia]